MVSLLRTLRALRDRLVSAGAAQLRAGGSPLSSHEMEYLLRACLSSYLVALGQGKSQPFADGMSGLAEREARHGDARRAEVLVFGFDLLAAMVDEAGPGPHEGDGGDFADDLVQAGRNAFLGSYFRARSEEDERRAQALAAFAEEAEGVPTIVYSTDREGRLTDISHRAAALLGYRKEELVGRHFSVLMEPEDADRFGHFIAERRTAQRATRRSKVALRTADGSVRGFELSSTGVYGRDGSYLGADGMARAAEGSELVLEYQLDNRGRILEISEAAAGVLGFQRAELVGQHFSVLMDEREQARVGRMFGERRRDQRAANGIRVLLTGHDGSQREFEISAVGRYDAAGEFSGTVGLGSDLTARLAFEHRVRDERRRFHALFDALDAGVLQVGRDRTIREANAWHLSRQRRPLEGCACYAAVFGLEAPCPWCRLDTVLRTGQSAHTEPVTHPVDGRLYHLRVSPLCDDQGKVAGFVELLVDVTEERGADRAKANAVRRDALDRALAGLIEQPGEQLLMATYAGVAGGCELADLNLAVHAALSEVEPLPSGVTVETELEPLLGRVSADAESLREAIAALLRNALEAMPEGGALTVETLVDSMGAAVRVTDSGLGMAADVRDRAAEPHFGTKGAPHAGLGLTFCEALARSAGGRLAVVVSPAGGVAAELWLPAARPDIPAGPPAVTP
jgi:PAS domain S-box-containing protein